MPYFVHLKINFDYELTFFIKGLSTVYMAISERTILIYVNQYTKYIHKL